MYSIDYTSNLSEVINLVLDDLRGKEAQAAALLHGVALDHVAAVGHRVQQRGVNTDGNRMQTRSPKQLGAYSRPYGRKRMKAGRQTDHVDLTKDGDLMNAFNVMPAEVQPGGVTVEAGFTTQRAAEIAGYLEAYYGPVFYPTQAERRVIVDAAKQGIVRFRLSNPFFS